MVTSVYVLSSVNVTWIQFFWGLGKNDVLMVNLPGKSVQGDRLQGRRHMLV